MVFIIGGAYQGKTAYAEEHFPSQEGWQLVNCYQDSVRRQLREGLSPLEEAEKLLRAYEGQRLVIICDEVGYGLVPVDAFERSFREQAGRVGGFLAGKAEQVIRVVCGIGTRIK